MSTSLKLLIIGKVWPEPRSSAAGRRMLDLISFFKESGFEVVFCTAAKHSDFAEDPQELGIGFFQVEMNNSTFDEFIVEISPNVVLFDRFMTEEQFGWRVDEYAPAALKILDTEDLHFLREARKEAVYQGKPVKEANLYSEPAKRELASIYRCDLSLIISGAESKILMEQFDISSGLIHYLPLKSKRITPDAFESMPGFHQRNDFISIGNFLHEPNWDSVLQLKEHIWPQIRKRLPEANLLVYGAYPSQKVFQLHDEKEGFLIKGRAENVSEVLGSSRVLLAPLRFGAGQKGKLLDAMEAGTPSVTTDIGAEGMIPVGLKWPGFVAKNEDDFVNAAVDLYKKEKLWNESQHLIPEILNSGFADSVPWDELGQKINILMKNLSMHRNRNFIGQILKHHQHASTKFMSKWIEEKQKSKDRGEVEIK